MMTIREYQEAVDKWIREHGVRYFNELTNTALLMEEVGELARVIARTHGEQSWKEHQAPSDAMAMIADEMGDVLFVMCCLANQMQIDLDKVVASNLDKKTLRDHKRHQANVKLRTDTRSD